MRAAEKNAIRKDLEAAVAKVTKKPPAAVEGGLGE